MTNLQEWRNWCYERHALTNHLYEGLPYSFHLKMVEQVVIQFEEVIPKSLFVPVLYSSSGHDLDEDARTSYNDTLKYLSLNHSYLHITDRAKICEIIFACTDNRGRNRAERHGGNYWSVMKDTEGAPITKYADRIANVKFGLLTYGHMLDKYRKENEELKKNISEFVPKEMVEYLDKLLITTI